LREGSGSLHGKLPLWGEREWASISYATIRSDVDRVVVGDVLVERFVLREGLQSRLQGDQTARINSQQELELGDRQAERDTDHGEAEPAERLHVDPLVHGHSFRRA